MAIPIFTTKFDLNSESADFKKMILTDTTDYPAAGYALADVRGVFKLTSPMGVVFYEGSFGTPDTNGATPAMTFKRDLPMISTDGFMLGTYTMEYFIQIAGTTEFSFSYTYELNPPESLVDATTGEIKEGCMTFVNNSFCQKLTITDTTEYGEYTTLDRTITLHLPSQLELPDVTTNNAVLNYTYTLINAGYETYLTSTVTFVDGYVTVEIYVELYIYEIVKGGKLSADLVNCYTLYSNDFLAYVSNAGGRIDNSRLVDMLNLIVYFIDYNNNLMLGNYTRVDQLYDLMFALINIRVKCPCACETTQPTFVDPYCGVGGGGGTDYTFAKTSPVTVSVVGTTVTYGLESSFTDKVNSLVIDNLTSGDGSVTITSSVLAGVKTWVLVVKNHISLNITILPPGGTDMQVTSSDVVRQGNRYLSGFPVANTDIQFRNYPHASLAVLNADLAVLYVKNFLTTEPAPGTDITDKIDVSIKSLLRTGATEGDAADFASTYPYQMKIKTVDNEGFTLQFYDMFGIPVTNADFLANVQKLVINLKINQ